MRIVVPGLAGMALMVLASSAVQAGEQVVLEADPESIPARFRLEPTRFEVTTAPKYTLAHSGVEVLTVSYPSAVVSPHIENNTVVGELFRPLNANGKTPAVLVLDIMDGAQVVSRMQAMWLASHGITAMTMHMAYYGPRRPPGSKLRMVMPDIEHSVTAITQTVKDGRRGLAYLAARPDVDAGNVGVLGTSLGSFIGGLVSASEPKSCKACLMLGGGGLVDVFYDHPKATLFRQASELLGGSKAKLKELIDPIDPIVYAEQLKTKKLLLIAANRDEVVPPQAMTRLWEATGKPKLIWVEGTHVGGALHMMTIMDAAIGHFK